MSARQFDPENPELMDRPGQLSEAWREDLANIRSLNRLFGGYRIVRDFFRGRLEAAGAARAPEPVRVLDLATGSADIPRLIVDMARARGIAVVVEAVDCHPATLEVAREQSASCPQIRIVESDIRDDAKDAGREFDFVICCLALHHFTEPDAVRILGRMKALSRRAALATDLRRCALLTGGARIVTATLYRQPMTRTDARMSAAAAFSEDELIALAKAAGWTDFGRARYFPGRQAIWIDKMSDASVVRS